MTAYRIRDWSKHFENNRTRELKELRFVILPNKHDGDGYTELLDHPNGAAHYGAWVAMVQVASKCDVRGTLVRDGDRAHDPASLSRLTRLPEKVFKEAIPRLVGIGWIEPLPQENQTDSEIPQEGATLSAAQTRTPSPKSAPEQNGIEEKGKEEKEERAQAPDSPPFSTPEFLSTLADFEQHRKEIRHKLTPKARQAMYIDFRDWGEPKAIEALRQSIRHQWRGVFEPKENGNGTNQPGTYQTASERRNAATVRNREREAELRRLGDEPVESILRR